MEFWKNAKSNPRTLPTPRGGSILILPGQVVAGVWWRRYAGEFLVGMDSATPETLVWWPKTKLDEAQTMPEYMDILQRHRNGEDMSLPYPLTAAPASTPAPVSVPPPVKVAKVAPEPSPEPVPEPSLAEPVVEAAQEPVGASEALPTLSVESIKEELAGLDMTELREEAKKLGVKSFGVSKDLLIQRIAEATAAE